MNVAARTLGVLILSSVLGGACESRPCSGGGIDPGDRYGLTVDEIYNEQSRFTFDWLSMLSSGLSSCSLGDGLVSGATLEIDATGTTSDRNGTCYFVTGTLKDAPPQLTILGPSGNIQASADVRSNSSTVMYALNEVKVGACTGVFGLAVLRGSPHGDLFAEPVPGTLPPAVLYRVFIPESGACQPCEDNFVIQLARE